MPLGESDSASGRPIVDVIEFVLTRVTNTILCGVNTAELYLVCLPFVLWDKQFKIYGLFNYNGLKCRNVDIKSFKKSPC